ncbi:MAG TPA: BatD family protein [Spirochaetia bacterium]|nr:BatD family protein [Spirochaetia bacterium]
MGSWENKATTACRKRLVAPTALVAALWLCAATAAAQTATGGVPSATSTPATTPQIVPHLSDTQVASGGQFTLTFDIAPANPGNLTVVEPDYPQALQKDGGPLIRPAIAGANPEAFRNQDAVEVQIDFTALRPGRYVIGQFRCQSGYTSFVTQPVMVAVTDPATGTVPPEARWIVSTATPYLGQTVYLQLALTDLVEPIFPDQISTTPPASGVFEEVRGLGKIRTAEYGSTVLYQVPVATYYLTPTTNGAVTIPAATVTVKGVKVRAPEASINVQTLPSRVQGSGAVGTFSFSATVANPEITEGDSFDLTLRVEGTGNLSYLHFPDIIAPDLVITSTTERNTYVPTENGYTGYREVAYQLSPRGAGTASVTIPEFSWIDPTTGSVHAANLRSFVLKTDPAPITAEPQSAAAGDKSPVFALLSVAQMRQTENTNAFERPVNYLWLLPGILVLAVVLFLRRQGKGVGGAPFVAGLLLLIAAASSTPFPSASLQAGIDAFQAGNTQRAINEFHAALSSRPHNAGILYNQALCYFQDRRYGEAIYYIDSAIRYRPTDSLMREALGWMETRIGLTRQIEPPWSVAPDLMLIITAILFNATCVLVAISGRGRGGRYAISLAFAVILVLTSAAGLVYTIDVQQTEIGVVGSSSGNLLKIPRADATSWLELQPGTTVRVLLDSNGFYLVRTGYGVEGWLPADDVLYHSLPIGSKS